MISVAVIAYLVVGAWLLVSADWSPVNLVQQKARSLSAIAAFVAVWPFHLWKACRSVHWTRRPPPLDSEEAISRAVRVMQAIREFRSDRDDKLLERLQYAYLEITRRNGRNFGTPIWESSLMSAMSLPDQDFQKADLVLFDKKEKSDRRDLIRGAQSSGISHMHFSDTEVCICRDFQESLFLLDRDEKRAFSDIVRNGLVGAIASQSGYAARMESFHGIPIARATPYLALVAEFDASRGICILMGFLRGRD